MNEYLIFAEVVNSARQDCGAAELGGGVGQRGIERRLLAQHYNSAMPSSQQPN